MEVYEFKGFPNPTRVRLALAEKGLFDAVKFVQVNVPEGEHRKPEFFVINPSGIVPVLELEDCTQISECSAIKEYLDHAKGDPDLMGQTPKSRVVIAMMQHKVEAGFLDAVAAYFHHATAGVGSDIKTHQNAAWGERQKETALNTMAWMNDLLADQDYLAGDQFTIADITAMAGFDFAGFAQIDMPAEFTQFATWRDRVVARPSVKIAA